MRRLFLIALLLVLALPLGLTSAQTADNLVDTAAADTELTVFVAALTATDLLDALAANGPYTVFAPSDAAFNAMLMALNRSVEDFFADTDQLREILQYHVITGEVSSSQLLTTSQLAVMNEGSVLVEATAGGLRLNGSALVTRPDILASNGVIHVIDQVLIPTMILPAPTPAPLPQPAFVRIGHFSTDMAEVDVYVDGVLRGEASLNVGQFTDWAAFPAATYAFSFVPRGGLLDDAVFGPVNVTVTDGSWTTLAVLGSSASATLRVAVIDEQIEAPLAPDSARVTFFHAVEDTGPLDVWFADELAVFNAVEYGEYAVVDIPTGDYDVRLLTVLTPEPLAVEIPTTMLEAGSHYFVAASGSSLAPLYSLDVVAHDDIVAMSSGLVTPTAPATIPAAPDIVEVLAADVRFTELLAALEAASLTQTLRDAPGATVFAPTNEAFSALPDGMIAALQQNPEALANLLLYHVILDDVSLDSADAPLTAVGLPLVISIDGTTTLLNDEILVSTIPLIAGNGRIYIVDAVLLPPTD